MSNPIERVHRVLNTIFRIYLKRDDPEWEAVLPMALLAYNTKVNSTTGVTPNEAWLGREAKIPLDLILPQPDERFGTVNEQVLITIRRFNLMYEHMRKNAGARIRRNTSLYSGKNNPFNCGDWIWYFSSRQVVGKSKKLTNNWIGPMTVQEVISPVLVQLGPALFEGRSFVAHITRCRVYTSP